jgi:hypothetical protein
MAGLQKFTTKSSEDPDSWGQYKAQAPKKQGKGKVANQAKASRDWNRGLAHQYCWQIL